MRWWVKMHVVKCRGIEESGIDARTFFSGDECQGGFRGCTLGVMPLFLRMPPQTKGQAIVNLISYKYNINMLT